MVKKAQKIDNQGDKYEHVLNDMAEKEKNKVTAPEGEENPEEKMSTTGADTPEKEKAAAAATEAREEQDEQDGELEDQEQDKKAEEKSREQELEEKVAALQDKYLRLTAEYDNYRKRTLREKMELQEGVREEVFVNILPVVDDLERAMESVSQAKDIKAVKTGMELIHTKFTKYLAQQGVKEVEAKGLELNTDQHEAITKIPVENKKQKGKIVDVVEKGYMLRDKVIRFAKVIIGE
jgi:molecular chaperone GrpE